MENVFEGKTCKAAYVPEKKTVLFTLVGYANIEEHKEMYKAVFEYMKKQPVIAFMHDLRQMKGTFTQINDWLIETFRPAVELGLKYVALIMNDDAFTAFAANDISKKMKIVELQMFRSQEDAESWIGSKL